VTYVDSSGRTLDDYPRPSVATDTAVLTLSGSQLSVLLTLTNDAVRGGEPEWRLPGTFLHQGETLADAVHRSLREKAGVDGLEPRQLRVFDDPARDDRGWVLSVAHFDVVREELLTASDRTRIVPVDRLPALTYDHAKIVAFAVEELRAEYRRGPDPSLLLEQPFTMRRLRQVHEGVAGEKLLPDSFRRAMLPRLEATGERFSDGRGRPAELYRRAWCRRCRGSPSCSNRNGVACEWSADDVAGAGAGGGGSSVDRG